MDLKVELVSVDEAAASTLTDKQLIVVQPWDHNLFSGVHLYVFGNVWTSTVIWEDVGQDARRGDFMAENKIKTRRKLLAGPRLQSRTIQFSPPCQGTCELRVGGADWSPAN